MNTESQNIEFKESWRDEYQKWICGFANAQGDTLYIGLRDNSEVCGVQDAKKLMEDIPNKVRDMMDYAEHSPIQIRVYENKLEIINGGVLPEGWTVETLLSSHLSMPYNPDIANTFFRAGEIEAWGRGIERIIMACKNDGFSTPEFRYDASGIWTTFKFEYPERATIQSGQKTTQKTTQKAIQNLTEQQQAILSFLKEHPEATRKEISDSLSGITEDGVKYNLSRLQELGLLKRIGGRKQGYWQIIE